MRKGTIITKKIRNKPIGTSVALQHKVEPGLDERIKHRGLSPSPKDTIEIKISNSFKSELLKINGNKKIKLEQLEENDLDFLCDENGRQSKLELTELVLAQPPYTESGDMAVIEYAVFADKLAELVTKKDGKNYSENIPIDLLIYSTHFAYHGNEYCVQLAAERLRHLELGGGFDRVYYLSHHLGTDHFTGGLARLYELKPYKRRLLPKERRWLEQNKYMTTNMNEGTAILGGTKYTF